MRGASAGVVDASAFASVVSSCWSVNGFVSSDGWLQPQTRQRPGSSPGGGSRRRVSSVPWSARLTPPLRARAAADRPGGRAGRWYHAVRRATMTSCRSFPTSTCSPTPSTPRWPDARAWRRRARSRWSCAAPRRSSRRSVASGSAAWSNGASSLSFALERDRIVVNPDAHRSPGDRGARDEAARVDRVRPDPRRARRRPLGRSRVDPRAPPGCRPTSDPSSCGIGTRRGWARSTSSRTGVPRPVAGWDEQGPDVDDPGARPRDLAGAHRSPLRRAQEPASQPGFVAGIGNGYSDEILWAAGLAPFRKRSTLAAEEVDRLWLAAREVPAWAIEELRTRVPPRFEIEVRDFLRVHRKGGQPCPRCGTPITEISPGGFVTSWCRSCQV